MPHQDSIIIKGLCQNNLKNISLEVPKEKIIVFTGVSGSGKSSIVFDTIAAESQRQMNETYTAYIRSRLPKFEKPKAEKIENLSASVIIDQTRLGGNARSTVGTISDMYSALRLLYSRIGEPYVGTASYFSFNNPNGMCPECFGIGKVMELDILPLIAEDKSWNEGMVDLPTFHVNNWYWKQYIGSGLFDPEKKWRDYTEEERNLLLYGSREQGGERVSKQVEGIHNMMSRLLLKRDNSDMSETSMKRLANYVHPLECPLCHGKRLNSAALSCKVAGYSINEMCGMELTGSALTGMTYIFDEPSTGMHPRDDHRMTKLLLSLRDKGNSVLVVEHDKDVICIADEVIDIGPLAGRKGGEILYQGSYTGLLDSGTLTGNAMKALIPLKETTRKPEGFLPVRNANIHNLKNVSADIPLNVLTAVTGVAGSGKSSLIRDIFAKQYEERVILVDQSPVTATCEACGGSRYSEEALSYSYHGKNIVDILDMNAEEAEEFFSGCPKIRKAVHAMVEVGLSYLSLGQPLSTLSGGERQRVKLAKYLDKRGNIYVLDEPTTGLHASDVQTVMDLLDSFVKRGNTVIVIEHNMDVVKLADYVIDIGPDGGTSGGEIVFTGTPSEMAWHGKTITAEYLRRSLQ